MKGPSAVIVATIVAWPCASLGEVERGRSLPSVATVVQHETSEEDMTLRFEETFRFWRKSETAIGWRLTAWLPSGCHRLVVPPGLVVDELDRTVVPIRLVVDAGPCVQAFTERTVEGELPVRDDGEARFLVVVTDEDERRLLAFEGRW